MIHSISLISPNLAQAHREIVKATNSDISYGTIVNMCGRNKCRMPSPSVTHLSIVIDAINKKTGLSLDLDYFYDKNNTIVVNGGE